MRKLGHLMATVRNHNVTEKSQHPQTGRCRYRLKSVGHQDALRFNCMTALFALFKELNLLPSVFALQSASSKHASGSQMSVCVHVRQDVQHFSALSGVTQRLVTPSVFVPTEYFPDSYTSGSGMSLLGSFSAISSIIWWLTSSQQLQYHCSKQVTPSLKPMGRGKTKPWRQSHRVWTKNRSYGKHKARLTEQHSSDELIIKAVFFSLQQHEKILENSTWSTATWSFSRLRAFITFELASVCSGAGFKETVRGEATASSWKTPASWTRVVGNHRSTRKFLLHSRRERAAGETSWFSSRTLEQIKSHPGHFGKSVSLGK